MDLLKQFRAVVVGRINAKQGAKELNHTPSWINEAETLAIFNQSWSKEPTTRPLREYFSSRKALKRAGSHGRVYYDAVIAKELADKYEPVSAHIERLSRAISGILAGFDSISIGCTKLIGPSEFRVKHTTYSIVVAPASSAPTSLVAHSRGTRWGKRIIRRYTMESA